MTRLAQHMACQGEVHGLLSPAQGCSYPGSRGCPSIPTRMRGLSPRMEPFNETSVLRRWHHTHSDPKMQLSSMSPYSQSNFTLSLTITQLSAWAPLGIHPNPRLKGKSGQSEGQSPSPSAGHSPPPQALSHNSGRISCPFQPAPPHPSLWASGPQVPPLPNAKTQPFLLGG